VILVCPTLKVLPQLYLAQHEQTTILTQPLRPAHGKKSPKETGARLALTSPIPMSLVDTAELQRNLVVTTALNLSTSEEDSLTAAASSKVWPMKDAVKELFQNVKISMLACLSSSESNVCWSAPSPWHVTWPIYGLAAPHQYYLCATPSSTSPRTPLCSAANVLSSPPPIAKIQRSRVQNGQLCSLIKQHTCITRKISFSHTGSPSFAHSFAF
jgi:hypothetical protein